MGFLVMNLSSLQSRLAILVQTAETLAGRPVIIEDKGNLVSELETALSTQSLAVVVAPAGGETKAGSLRGRSAWDTTLEVVIHRGQLDTDPIPSTVAVLDELVPLIHGAPIDPNNPALGEFACRRHELREGGDGSYCRVLTVLVTHPWSQPSSTS
jgi:hypothetical protein